MSNKKPIRFLIDENIYDELKERAEQLDIPLASYLKANLKEWALKKRK